MDYKLTIIAGIHSFNYYSFGEDMIVVAVKPNIDRQGQNSKTLEGIFVTDSPITDFFGVSSDAGNPACKRDNMYSFEQEYNGMFIPKSG